MAYIVPQTRIFEQSAIQPTVTTSPKRVCLLAPHAFLVRYSVASEKILGRLDYYDRLLDAAFPWPNRPAGALVDLSQSSADYSKIFIENALLHYLDASLASGHSIVTVAGKANRLHADDINWKANGDYARTLTLLPERDVQPGDVVKVRALNEDGDPITLWSKVKEIRGELVPAVISPAEADTANPASQSQSASVEKVAGADNCIDPTADASAYNGYVTGFINETYDLIVTESSVNGDLTTARLRVISGSGADDHVGVQPAAAGDPTAIGDHGLEVTFNYTPGGPCSDDAEDGEVTPYDLILGQRWRVTVAGDFTKPVATEGGDYSGGVDTTYIIEVTRGGLYADTVKPMITVTTTTGVDRSGPTVVSAAASDVAVGTNDLLIQFSGLGLRKGDKYYISVLAEAEGPMRYLDLTNNLDESILAGTEAEVSLFILQPTLEVPRNILDNPPNTNWDTSETEITLKAAIQATDDSWTVGGVPEPLDVWSESSKNYGMVYVQYRAWLSDLAGAVNDLGDVSELNTLVSGDATADNPLKLGLLKTAANSGGQPILFSAIADPDDLDSWAAALEDLVNRDDVYHLVPLTTNKLVHELVFAHCQAMSSPERKRWRVCYTAVEAVPYIPLVSTGSDISGHIEATTSDSQPALCKVLDDPETSGTQYTRVLCTSGNANFVSNGLRAGDLVRVAYSTDGFGNDTYQQFLVDRVISEEELRLVSGPSAPINVAARTEVWRALRASEEAIEIGHQAGAFSNELMRKLGPDVFEDGGVALPGYYLCCMVAGLAAGVLPNQGLTRVELIGASSVNRTSRYFTQTELDVMAEAGVWLIVQDPRTGRIYSRHAVTTAPTDILNQREEMMVRNKHDILYQFADAYEPFVGRTNITPTLLRRVRDVTVDILGRLEATVVNVDLGPQILEGAVTNVRQNPINLDRIDVFATATLVTPNNGVDLYIQF